MCVSDSEKAISSVVTKQSLAGFVVNVRMSHAVNENLLRAILVAKQASGLKVRDRVRVVKIAVGKVCLAQPLAILRGV